MPKKVGALILAAGKGTRLRSELPKALHTLCGKPMLGWLVDRAAEAGAKTPVIVAGYRADLVKAWAGSRHKGVGGQAKAKIVLQKNQLGSGHAVACAQKAFRGFKGTILLFYCDTPVLTRDTVARLLKHHRDTDADATLLSVSVDDPAGYGRVKRAADGRVLSIVEELSATADEKTLREINVGLYAFESDKLFAALKKVGRDTKKKEYYLTDVIAVLAENGRVEAVETADREEVQGVNSMKELARAEATARQRVLEALMDSGVRIRDPRTTTIDADVRIGQDTTVLPHTVIEEGTSIGRKCVIGPFARLRAHSKIGDRVVIGNFVEIVRSEIGNESQVKHLTYLGDARVGRRVNVGAGTITANYDGRAKHATVIGDGASIGSGTVLVAPVRIGARAKTGAGSVVPARRDVPAGKTVIGVPARVLKK